MVGVNLRKLQWLEVSQILKAKYRGKELHHVFSRVGRALACERFIVPLTSEAHRGPGYGKLTVELRDKHREAVAKMAEANAQNMDVASCWWHDCEYSPVCPLHRRALTLDRKEMAKLS